MVQVESEAIAAIEYDASSGTLFVQFSSGDWYSYFGVSERLHAEFEAAESKGRFFQQSIRNHYFYRGPLSV